MTADSAAAHRIIDAVWRIESARIIAGLARLVRDVGLAEELAQDALVAPLEQWPAQGIPARPGAWLMLTAKHRPSTGSAATKVAPASSASSAARWRLRSRTPAKFDAVLDELVTRHCGSVGCWPG